MGNVIFSESFMNLIRNFMLIMILISLGYSLCVSLCMGSVFDKAKKKTYQRYIPFYNIFVLLDILKQPSFYALLIFIPIVNIFFIIALDKLLCEFYDKSRDFLVALVILPFVYMQNLVKEKGKNKRVEVKKKEKMKAPKYSMKSMDTNLLTDKELENLNNTKIDEPTEIDSIFKADIDMETSAAPYKAGKQKMKVIDEEPNHERETIKRVESVKAKDIRKESKFIKEEDITETIE